ncbi:MAG TPA: nuclear transport factor 2 family protein [Gemmatimonadaceae bacterium]|nr:nuclear transport factor 2 family protein [Gemmatimonadaceae bacterium]
MSETVIRDTMKVGQELVEMCRNGRAADAIETLYAPDIVSIEAMSSPAVPGRVEGLNAVRGKNDWWQSNHEVHGAKVEGPWPHGDRFIVRFNFDVTAKDGPMAGQRMLLDETALYTVADGKIVQEEFFYNM